MTVCRLFNSRQTARLLACLVFCAFFLVYKSTLLTDFFPGESARQMAVALKMEANDRRTRLTIVQRRVVQKAMVRHPRGGYAMVDPSDETEVLQERQLAFRTRQRVWTLLSSAVAKYVPLGSLPVRMNTLSAVIGALSAATLFALVRGLFLLLTFHLSPIAARRRKMGAVAAGLAAAVALGTSVPFWISATRFLPDAFEVLLLVLMGWLLLTAVVRHNDQRMLAFGFLLSISVFEFDAGFLMVPLMLFFAARAIRMGDLGAAHGGVSLVSGMAFGGAAYLMLNWLTSPIGGGFTLPFRELSQSFRIFGRMLTGGWLSESINAIVLCFVILPALAAIALAIWGDRERESSSTVLLLLTLLGTSTIALTGSSISPWGAIRIADKQQMPVVLFLLAALVVGYLVGEGFLLAGGKFLPDVTRSNRHRTTSEESGNMDSPLGRLLMGFVWLLLSATCIFNFRELIDWREPLSVRVADEVVRRLEGRRWVVTDGMTATLIRLHGRMNDQFVGVLNTHGLERMPDGRTWQTLQRDPAFSTLDFDQLRQRVRGTNDVSFAQALMAVAPHPETSLFVLNDAKLWNAARCEAVPDVVGFCGVADNATVDWTALLQAHYAFWDDIERIPPIGPYAPAWLRGFRAGIRQQLYAVGARLANDLARAGRLDDAENVLDRVARIREEPPPNSLDLFY